jgi:serine phosphatase RsbU (regulator of sigma subunit)
VALGIGLPRALAHVNALLLGRPRCSICTVAAALLREDGAGAHAVLCLAGHPPPVVVRASARSSSRRVAARCSAPSPSSRRRPNGWTWGPGDALVLYTDGVTDAGGEHERFGFDRLLACLREARTTAPEELVAALDGALARFQAGPQRDDVAVLAVRRTP